MSHPTLYDTATAAYYFAPSLWSRIAPFDRDGRFLNRALWSLLDDEDVMAAMMANAATMQHLRYFRVRHTFELNELRSHSRSSACYWPVICRVVRAEPFALSIALPQLSQCSSLVITTIRRLSNGRWTVRLSPSLTELRLTVTGKVWKELCEAEFPSVLHRLTIDADVARIGHFTEWLCSPLPPNVHTLNIRTPAWDWPTFQRLHLTADSTQLRSLSDACTYRLLSHLPDISLLPRSLTELALSVAAFSQPPSALHLPNLHALRLGATYGVGHVHFLLPITIDVFAGLPVLRELDLRRAESFESVRLLPAMLPATLTSLSLPVHYWPSVARGALPPSLQQLHMAHAADLAGGAGRLEPSCLPAGLVSFVVEQHRGDDGHMPLPFTHHLSILPLSIVELRILNHAFNHSLEPLTALPHLITLAIDSTSFAQPLEPITRLTQLRTLQLHIDFPSPLPPLPARLLHLTVRPASGFANNLPRRGYTHQLTSAQFAQCTRLELLSIDADEIDESTSGYVHADRDQQQQRYPLFDSPIAARVLPASLERLRLPQHYRYAWEDVRVCLPEQCRVWLGGERVR